ncbi:Uncharacterised protein [Vibrio cholerae]|uniref:Uncharacterized protein n=1 Tax=Vibrio cholerae TaxID=666 RepID=A0A655ZYJ1_VIBCL|nr:Uncharacterised protein [Vibrio cholerae]
MGSRRFHVSMDVPNSLRVDLLGYVAHVPEGCFQAAIRHFSPCRSRHESQSMHHRSDPAPPNLPILLAQPLRCPQLGMT